MVFQLVGHHNTQIIIHNMDSSLGTPLRYFCRVGPLLSEQIYLCDIQLTVVGSLVHMMKNSVDPFGDWVDCYFQAIHSKIAIFCSQVIGYIFNAISQPRGYLFDIYT